MKVRSVDFVTSSARVAEAPRDGLPEVAFVGPSNVGKSSLINALVGRRGLARTSKTPGRTRLANWFRVNDDAFLVDLPGYGYAKASRTERQRLVDLVEEYLAGSPNLRLLLFLQDCRRTPSVRDLELKGWLDEHGVPHVVVLTKSDKLSRGALARQAALVRRAFGPVGATTRFIPFSAQTGDGKRELWSAIDAAIAGSDAAGDAAGTP